MKQNEIVFLKRVLTFASDTKKHLIERHGERLPFFIYKS